MQLLHQSGSLRFATGSSGQRQWGKEGGRLGAGFSRGSSGFIPDGTAVRSLLLGWMAFLLRESDLLYLGFSGAHGHRKIRLFLSKGTSQADSQSALLLWLFLWLFLDIIPSDMIPKYSGSSVHEAGCCPCHPARWCLDFITVLYYNGSSCYWQFIKPVCTITCSLKAFQPDMRMPFFFPASLSFLSSFLYLLFLPPPSLFLTPSLSLSFSSISFALPLSPLLLF